MKKTKRAKKVPSPKPCPFCGKQAKIDVYHTFIRIGCNNLKRCHVSPFAYAELNGLDAGIRHWNKRA